jgi:hypothetical protein
MVLYFNDKLFHLQPCYILHQEMEKIGWGDRKALLKNFFGKHILLLECIHLTISSFYSGMLVSYPFLLSIQNIMGKVINFL